MSDAALCPVHPGESVIGACQRCGDFVCRLCLRGTRLLCAKCSPGGDAPKPDLGKAIGFVFQDPRWLSKVLMGTLWLLFAMLFFFLPIVNMAVLMGYGVRIARREQEGPRRELPEWDELGDLFSMGAKYSLCQMLPALALMFSLMLIAGIILGIVAIAASVGGGQVADAVAVAGMIAFMCFYIAIIPLSLLMGFIMPAVHVHHIRTGRIGAGLEFRELWKIISTNFGDYLMLWLFCFVVQFLGTLAGEMMCLVGLFVAIPWVIFTQQYLVGRYIGWLDAQEGKTLL